jgi:hypothetical protein
VKEFIARTLAAAHSGKIDPEEQGTWLKRAAASVAEVARNYATNLHQEWDLR